MAAAHRGHRTAAGGLSRGPGVHFHGLRRLLHGPDADRDLDDEVSQFIEASAREHEARGLSRADALRQARLDFGGIEAAKEAVRSSGWDAVVNDVGRDLAGGVRALRRNPTFTAVACLTLALGIGANTAMFTVVDAILLRPLPYRAPRDLALVWTDDTRRGLHEERTAYRTILDWRVMSRTLRDVAFFATQRAPLGNDGVREMTRAAYVSGNLFSMLGARAAIGRPISVDDERDAEPVAVISYSLWRRRFGGDSSVIGRLIDTEDLTKDPGGEERVIGVMPDGFYFPDKLTEIWIPATTYWRFQRESIERFPDWARRWTAVARLRPGVSIDDARADMSRVGRRLASLYHSDVAGFPGFAVNVVPILDHVIGPNLERALWLLFGAVSLVLLVACANVANLSLARGSATQRELAVRRALGATHGRLVRQLLAESLVLAVAGGLLGLALAWSATRVLTAFGAAHVPRIEETTMDGRVFAFALAVSLAAGVVFGIVPALRAASADPAAALQSARSSAGGSAGRTRGLLVVVECALAVVVLVAAGLLLRSLARLHSVDPGFDPSHVLTMRLVLPPEPPPSAEERTQTSRIAPARARLRERMIQDVVARVAALPGVERAGFIDDMFVTGSANHSITIPGRQADSLAANALNEGSATPDLFATLHVPLLEGRWPTRADADRKIDALWSPIVTDQTLAEKESRAIPEPVVVNESFARRFFAGEDPIGKRFCIDPTNKTYWYEIVGVVGDMHRQGLEHAAVPEYFGPLIPPANGRVDLMVRVRGNPADFAASVRQVVRGVAPRVMIQAVSTADRQLGDFSAQRRFQTWLLTAFASLALALAMIGVYGVLHYAVAERTNEIGIRIALGASPGAVVAMAMRQGMRLPLLGLALGMGGAFAVTRVLGRLLFETGTTDVTTYAGVVIVLALCAAVACYAPARRAARVDPLAALRRD